MHYFFVSLDKPISHMLRLNLCAFSILLLVLPVLHSQDADFSVDGEEISTSSIITLIAQSPEYEAWAALTESNVLRTSSADFDFGRLMVLLGDLDKGVLSLTDFRLILTNTLPEALTWYDNLTKTTQLMKLVQARYPINRLTETQLKELSKAQRKRGFWTVSAANAHYDRLVDAGLVSAIAR